MAAYLDPVRRRALALIAVLAASCYALSAVLFLAGPSDPAIAAGVASTELAAVLCLLRAAWIARHRLAWAGAGAGLAAWGIGLLLDLASPTAAAGFEDLFYLLGAVGLLVLVIGSSPGRLARRRLFWLDCANAAFTLGALYISVMVPLAAGFATREGADAALVNLAYPLAIAVLIAVLIVGNLTAGWRPDRSMWVLLGSLLLLHSANLAYFVEIERGRYSPNAIDALWYLALLGIAAAAWQSESVEMRSRARASTVAIGLPVAAASVCGATLVVGTAVDLPVAATICASLGILGAAIRVAIAFGDVRSIAAARSLELADGLTELPNREVFMSRVEERIAAGGGVALALIEVDGFRGMRTTLGYEAADVALLTVAGHLRVTADSVEHCARMGGHQFALMIDRRDPVHATGFARALGERLDHPVRIDETTLRVSVSCGIAIAPDHGESAELLIRAAERALIDGAGVPGSIRVYDRSDVDEAERLRLVGEIGRAIAARELELYLQPVARMGTGEIAGAEALVRWSHPSLGLLSPARFVPAVEQTDLARRFSDYVLETAIRHIVELHGAGLQTSVSANLTADDIVDPRLPREVERLLRRFGVNPTSLVLEVTEDGVMTDFDAARRAIEQLRSMGVRIALDDFGTGRSSLAYLRELDADIIKLDRSFVAPIGSDESAAAIVRGVIDISHSLGRAVLAEGVETAAQWRALAAWGCDLAQGWLIARPQPIADLIAGASSIRARARETVGDEVRSDRP